MKSIIWNRLALLDYHKNIDYLLKKWTEQEAIKFIGEVESVIYRLKKGNVSFEDIGYKNIKKCVVRKQITLYYRHLSENQIELLRFWNNYQDVEKIKFK